MIHLVAFLKSLPAEKRIPIQGEKPATSTTVAPLFPFLALMMITLFLLFFFYQLSHFYICVYIIFSETKSVILDSY